MPAIDTVTSRNNTQITIRVNGGAVGRVQGLQYSQANNVQVIAEMGRDYPVEMQKGLTVFTFSMDRFFTRVDVFDGIRGGAPFSLDIVDNGANEVIDTFEICMVQGLSRSFSQGAVNVGQNVNGVMLGKGKLGL